MLHIDRLMYDVSSFPLDACQGEQKPQQALRTCGIQALKWSTFGFLFACFFMR